ncbi:DNA excision repair protein ERCC-6-like protein [Chelonia mydas]|uniref:DNA excision repair protein ERCC-6-like n=1 Tax=Chelonia mydas TaxID=8469 RepID=M7BJ72_CHEMY|nr:DNA excision repair protein ERCC-6-like protein [Chelonia mydas]
MAGPGPAGLYERYVTQAKEEARNGNLEESLKLFNLANEIHPSEKLRSRIKRLEETLAELALATEEEEGFVDVCNSGLMIYGEMHNKLFEYQKEGVAFLYSLYRDGRQGGILADDMGLGKTIQIIALLSGMFDAELIQFVLLVMPTTLVSNWMREFTKWTPGLRVKDFHGTSKTERNRKLERIQRKNGIAITTYQMLINNWQQLSSLSGREFVWDYIILDEAHKIKSPSAKTTKSVYAIPAKNRILLTGTPVQNNLREMWSLFDFACQGSLLGTAKTFKMEYENPITRAREKDATPGEKALGLKISENLMTIIKPYFLRRTKEDIQKKYNSDKVKTHLPEDQSKNIAPVMPSLTRKNDFIVWVYLAPVQEEIYRNFLSLDHVKEVLMTTRSPLAELNVLKKLCDHPRLLSARACSQLGLEGGGYPEQDDENEGGAFSGTNKIDHLSDEILIQESGKLMFLMGLLERLQEEGHRTLVFSQSRKMLDILERILTHRHFRTMRIDGTVTHLVERERRIVEPANDEAVDHPEDEDVANVSARMTSLVIVDSEEEKSAQDVSNMDVNELHTSSKVLKQSNIHEPEQKLDPNFIPSSLGVYSFVNKESHSPESRRHSHRSQSINDVQITSSLFSQPSFNGSVFANDPKRYRNAEMSLQTHDPYDPEDDGNENPELASPGASKSLLNVMSEFPSGLQKSHVSEASLEATSVAFSQYQADFNLVLEDSEDGQQDVSKREKLLEYTENTGFHLQVGNHGSSAMNSWVREDDDNFGNSCNVAMDNLNDSIPVSEALMESGDDMPIGKKKRARRIVSDSEDEDNSVMILDENLPEKMSSPLNSPLCPSLMGISSSTPKCDKSIVNPIFSPRGNKSTASRRSLIIAVLDEVEDIEETIGALSQTEDSDEVQEELVVEEAEEHSVEPEEEPIGETLDTEGTTSYLDDTESVISEADDIEEESQEESTGDPELLSGEQMDCFSKESAGQKDNPTTVDSLHAPDNYDALIECGKKLKDNGKLQDALNCFLQALDIKNGDPEVMLITLNLYKQLLQR